MSGVESLCLHFSLQSLGYAFDVVDKSKILRRIGREMTVWGFGSNENSAFRVLFVVFRRREADAAGW